MIDIELSKNISTNERMILRLTSNETISLAGFSYPIIWTGYINNDKLEVHLLSSISSIDSNYKFVTLPVKYSDYTSEIMKAIDDRMHVLLD